MPSAKQIRDLIDELRTKPWHRTPYQLADKLDELFNGSKSEITRWDKRFLRLAQFVAAWSKDPSTQVGAVIVRPDRTIASLGFNGLPRGVADTPIRLHEREVKYRFVVHAELNAILHAREPLAGYTIYSWPFPLCSSCAGAAIQAGIKRVVSCTSDKQRWQESWETAHAMFKEAGVQVCLKDPSL